MNEDFRELGLFMKAEDKKEWNALKKSYECLEDVQTEPRNTLDWMGQFTSESGMLVMPKLGCEESEDEEVKGRSILCYMDWKYEDIDNVYTQFQYLIRALETIYNAKPLSLDDKDLQEVLEPEAYDVYDRLIRSFEPENMDMDRVYRILGYLGDGDILSNRDKYYLDTYLAARDADIEKNVGEGYCGKMLALYARRVLRLMEIDCPEDVLNYEKCQLMKATALYMHCTSVYELTKLI
jgi:hypothetical protein